MVRLSDIFKAMCDHIRRVTGVPIADGDLVEPIVRPSFKIFTDTVSTGFFSSGLRQSKVYFSIYYYASERKRSKSEIMAMEDRIAQSFLEPFRIKKNCYAYVDDVEFERVTDGILNIRFNLEAATGYQTEEDKRTDLENGLMEDLYLKEEQEK